MSAVAMGRCAWSPTTFNVGVMSQTTMKIPVLLCLSVLWMIMFTATSKMLFPQQIRLKVPQCSC